MFKKFFSIVGVMGLICFSFYYTHLATVVVKNNDPIMKKIINVSKTYTQKPINATFSNNSIIPGVSGLEVDLDKSYESMKKYGSFNEDLVVLKSVTPLVSVSNIYDKYITRGNDRNNNIALIIIMTLLEVKTLNITDMNVYYAFKQIASAFLPVLSKNILFTYLAYCKNYVAAVCYDLLIYLVLWLSPILPNMTWFMIAIIDIATPIILLLYIRYIKLMEKY